MNRNELAALLAQTHSIPHSPHRQTSPLRSDSLLPAATSPASPRQIFQSRVRTLSDDGDSTKILSPSPTRRSKELQHLSSLRVHVRNAHGLSSPRAPSSSDFHRSKHWRFHFSSAEPDFVTEERAAWDTERPNKKSSNHDSEVPNVPSDGVSQADDPSVFESELHDAKDTDLPLLKPFGPASTSRDVNERPKTRHGHGAGADTIPGAFPTEDPMSSNQAVRRSKFMEGSMTDRSVAVASSWSEQDHVATESSNRSSEDTDSDATPKAIRASRDSLSSCDLSDFRPAPITPSTIRGKISKLVKRPNDSSTKPVPEEKKPKRKGLRKSISTWSFHNIGDKMRFFGASSTDLPAEDQPSSKQGNDAHLQVLNERKRKAEEVYAQQFGTKKQRSNDGIPVQNTHKLRTQSQPHTFKKRNISERTIIPASTIRHHRKVPDSIPQTAQEPADIVGGSDHDRRKRPSRVELEKENQQLRAMLREQQAQQTGYMHRSASKSTVHLPLDNHAHSTRRVTSQSASPSRSLHGADTAKPFKSTQDHGRSVPPVPALPSRAVLASLNGQNNDRFHTTRDTGTMKRHRGGSRPVFMILEEEVENDPADKIEHGFGQSSALMSPHGTTTTARAQKDGSWQWPDDIF